MTNWQLIGYYAGLVWCCAATFAAGYYWHGVPERKPKPQRRHAATRKPTIH